MQAPHLTQPDNMSSLSRDRARENRVELRGAFPALPKWMRSGNPCQSLEIFAGGMKIWQDDKAPPEVHRTGNR